MTTASKAKKRAKGRAGGAGGAASKRAKRAKSPTRLCSLCSHPVEPTTAEPLLVCSHGVGGNVRRGRVYLLRPGFTRSPWLGPVEGRLRAPPRRLHPHRCLQLGPSRRSLRHRRNPTGVQYLRGRPPYVLRRLRRVGVRSLGAQPVLVSWNKHGNGPRYRCERFRHR